MQKVAASLATFCLIHATPTKAGWEPAHQSDVRKIQEFMVKKDYLAAERAILDILRQPYDPSLDSVLPAWYEQIPEQALAKPDTSHARAMWVEFAYTESNQTKSLRFGVGGEFPEPLEQIEFRSRLVKEALVSLKRDCAEMVGRRGQVKCLSKAIEPNYPGPGLYEVIARTKGGTFHAEFVLPLDSIRPFRPTLDRPRPSVTPLSPLIQYKISNLNRSISTEPNVTLAFSRKDFDVPVKRISIASTAVNSSGALLSPVTGPVTLTLEWNQQMRTAPVAFRQTGHIEVPVHIKE